MLSRIQEPRLALAFAVAGAVSFWLPDLAVHVIAGRAFDAPHVRVITLLMPIAFVAAYVLARRLGLRRGYKRVGIPMLVGVWLMGGVFMTISATVAGGGFVGPDGIKGGLILILLSVFPLFTFIMSAYDGSLLALLAVTLGAPAIWGVWAMGEPLALRRRR